MTTDDLARRSGVKFGTVRNLWQNRTQDPSFSTLIAIAKALNVTIEDLAVEGKIEEESVNNSRPLRLAA